VPYKTLAAGALCLRKVTERKLKKFLVVALVVVVVVVVVAAVVVVEYCNAIHWLR
jgi:hypothetical protein